eukprot:TRINITY_DN13239_c0_g1_i1.p1 TRINITY_DN13239_c0_g1~~TRINITY_DN13239_c0_g1_i1.p1  ORF type:complete len:195 (+),score=41.73 TRINITY_DN13239_c0_g1_i1:45-629(+)
MATLTEKCKSMITTENLTTVAGGAALAVAVVVVAPKLLGVGLSITSIGPTAGGVYAFLQASGIVLPAVQSAAMTGIIATSTKVLLGGTVAAAGRTKVGQAVFQAVGAPLVKPIGAAQDGIRCIVQKARQAVSDPEVHAQFGSVLKAAASAAAGSAQGMSAVQGYGALPARMLFRGAAWTKGSLDSGLTALRARI